MMSKQTNNICTAENPFGESLINSPGILGKINFGPSTNNWPETAPSQPYYIKPIVDGPKIIMTPQIQKQLDEAALKSNPTNKHAHYFKDVSKLNSIDVYRVLELFGVTDQALGHAIKKLLVAGGRGAGKSIEKDIEEAIVSLQRCLQMKREVNGKT